MGYRVDWASPGFSSWIEKMTAGPKPVAIRRKSRAAAPPAAKKRARAR